MAIVSLIAIPLIFIGLSPMVDILWWYLYHITQLGDSDLKVLCRQTQCLLQMIATLHAVCQDSKESGVVKEWGSYIATHIAIHNVTECHHTDKCPQHCKNSTRPHFNGSTLYASHPPSKMRWRLGCRLATLYINCFKTAAALEDMHITSLSKLFPHDGLAQHIGDGYTNHWAKCCKQCCY